MQPMSTPMVAGPAPCSVMFTDGRAKLLNLKEKIVSVAPMMDWTDSSGKT